MGVAVRALLELFLLPHKRKAPRMRTKMHPPESYDIQLKSCYYAHKVLVVALMALLCVALSEAKIGCLIELCKVQTTLLLFLP